MRRAEIGFGVREHPDQLLPRPDVVANRLAVLSDIACEQFGGCTYHAVDGSWRTPNGQHVFESGFIFRLDGLDTHGLLKVKMFAAFVRDTMKQSCVIVTFYDVESEFV